MFPKPGCEEEQPARGQGQHASYGTIGVLGRRHPAAVTKDGRAGTKAAVVGKHLQENIWRNIWRNKGNEEDGKPEPVCPRMVMRSA